MWDRTITGARVFCALIGLYAALSLVEAGARLWKLLT